MDLRVHIGIFFFLFTFIFLKWLFTDILREEYPWWLSVVVSVMLFTFGEIMGWAAYWFFFA